MSLRKISAPFADIVPIKLYTFITKQKVIFPFYHTVSNMPGIHVKGLYNIKSEKDFERDLDFFLRNYEAGKFKYENILNTISQNKRTFFLSFDDGLSECYDIIAPILLKKGVHAAFFINPVFLDNKALLYRFKLNIIKHELEKFSHSKSCINEIKRRLPQVGEFEKHNLTERVFKLKYNDSNVIDSIAKVLEIDFDFYLNKHKPYMSSEQVKYLKDKGFTLGAHSMTHVEFIDITMENQIEEIKNSVSYINSMFKEDEKLFAFPFSDVGISEKLYIIISKENITKMTFGTSGLKKDSALNNIQRIPMEDIDISAGSRIKSEYLVWFIKQFLGRNKIKRI